MQADSQDPTQAPLPGDDALLKHGNGGSGADSALARMKEQERSRAGLRHRDAEHPEGGAAPLARD